MTDKFDENYAASPQAPDFAEAEEPFELFAAWLKDAAQHEINDAEAMALATVDPEGMPNVRMVLLKGASTAGFVFYTNYESAKGRQLAAEAHDHDAVTLALGDLQIVAPASKRPPRSGAHAGLNLTRL